jgi:hypothetical protein
MPGSVTFSGGGSAALNSNSVALGIDKSSDVDALLLKLDSIVQAIGLLNFQSVPITDLLPSIVSAPNQAITSPIIQGMPGKQLFIKFSAWYDETPIGGKLEILGTDNQTYYVIPLIAAKVGVLNQGARLPIGVGFRIILSAGGEGVTGFVNYASTVV